MSDRCITSQAPPACPTPKDECFNQPAVGTCQEPLKTECDENNMGNDTCGGISKVECGSSNQTGLKQQQQHWASGTVQCQIAQQDASSTSMMHNVTAESKFEHSQQAKFEHAQQSKYEHQTSSSATYEQQLLLQHQQQIQAGQSLHQAGSSSSALLTGGKENSSSSLNQTSVTASSNSASNSHSTNYGQSVSSSSAIVSGQYEQGQAQVQHVDNQQGQLTQSGGYQSTTQASMTASLQQQEQSASSQHALSATTESSNTNVGLQQGQQQLVGTTGQTTTGQYVQQHGSSQFHQQQQHQQSSVSQQSSQQQHHASSSSNTAASNSGLWVTSSTGAAQVQAGKLQNVNTGRVDDTQSGMYTTQGTFQGGHQGNLQGQFASTGKFSSWSSSTPTNVVGKTGQHQSASFNSTSHSQEQQKQQQGQASFASSQWSTSGSAATGGTTGQASTTYGGYSMTSDGRVTGQSQTIDTIMRPSHLQATQGVSVGTFQGQGSTMTGGKHQQTLMGHIPTTVHSAQVGGINYNSQQHDQAASSSYSHQQASSESSHQASSSSSLASTSYKLQHQASQGQIDAAYRMSRELDFGGASEVTDRSLDQGMSHVDSVQMTEGEAEGLDAASMQRASTYRPQHVAGGPMFFGPFIKFGSTSTLQGETHYSVMVLAKPGVTVAPSLAVRFLNVGAGVVHMPKVGQPQLLDCYAEHRFWRFMVTVPMVSHQSLKVEYMVNGCGSATFNVPSKNEQFKWAFMTCNGFSSDVKPRVQAQHSGIDPMWTDILREHAQKEFHGMVIGGDTVYMDDIWTVPAVKEWLDMRGDKSAKVSAPWTAKMNSQAHKFYFDRYMAHFTLNGFAQGLASLPYLCVWDDHDIFDGFGSYPAYLQNSPVFRGIFVAAQRFYLLFQHHTNLHLAREKYSPIDNYIGASDKLPIAGHTAIRNLGMRTAIVMLDTRTERSLTRIISEQSWHMIRLAVENHIRLNPTVEHLVLCATVPMIYPRMHIEDFVEVAGKVTHGIMSALSSLPITGAWWKALTKTGVYGNIVDSLGEPQLADDLGDHWTSDGHVVERDSVIMALQELAAKYRVRVSIVSGDVHCAGAGEVGPKVGTAVTRDQVPSYMTQIISSAVGNISPPWFVIKGLHMVSKQRPISGSDTLVERMLNVFPKDVNGRDLDRDEQSLMARRNWLSVLPEGPGVSDESKTLAFTLHMEKKVGDLKGETVDYTIRVPHVASKLRPRMTEVEEPAGEMHFMPIQQTLIPQIESLTVGGPQTATPMHILHQQQQASAGLVGR